MADLTRPHPNPRAPLADVRERRVPARTPAISAIGNPMPIALGLLAFQLVIFGIQWWNTNLATLGKSGLAEATETALLVAGAAQLLAGLVCLVRGEGYRGQIAAMFGIWLIGMFVLGKDEKAPPLAAAWFLLTLVLPLAIIMIPAVISRIWTFVAAFLAIIVQLLTAGLGFRGISEATGGAAPDVDRLGSSLDLLHVAAVAGWVAAAALAWMMIEDLLRDHRALGGTHRSDADQS